MTFSPACDAGGGHRSFIDYDSAGVRITESSRPGWEAGQAFTVERVPALEIGTLHGPEEYQFTDIAAVWRREDGTIVVGDRAALEVRIFDPEGAVLTTFGREGDGPGEFLHLSALSPYRGDSVAVWDTRLKRLSVFDAEGRLGRTQRISLATVQEGHGERSWGISESYWGAFTDGSLAFSPMKILAYRENEEPVFRRPILRVSDDGDPLATLGPHAVAEARRPGRPFARVETVAVSGSRVYSGEGDAFQVQVWNADGELERIIRIPGRSVPVDANARSAFADWYRERQRALDRPDEQIERALAETDFPSALPAYSKLVVDDHGYLWAQDYRLETDPRAAVWNVFDPDGRWLGYVETPAGVEVHAIGGGYLVGVRTDELDVPYVEKYRLMRP